MPALDDILHRRIEFGLDPDDLDLGLERFRRDRHPADQPAAADRHHQQVEIGRGVEHLERDRPLPRDHIDVVERVDEHHPMFLLQFAGMGMSIVEHLAAKHRIGAMALGLGDLHCRSRFGHHDRHRDAEPLAVISDRLGMIARRRRDHPARALLRGQLEQFVERPALLVGRGELKVFELEPHFGADQFAERAAYQRRGLDHRAVDAGGGGANVVEGRTLHCHGLAT